MPGEFGLLDEFAKFKATSVLDPDKTVSCTTLSMVHPCRESDEKDHKGEHCYIYHYGQLDGQPVELEEGEFIADLGYFSDENQIFIVDVEQGSRPDDWEAAMLRGLKLAYDSPHPYASLEWECTVQNDTLCYADCDVLRSMAQGMVHVDADAKFTQVSFLSKIYIPFEVEYYALLTPE